MNRIVLVIWAFLLSLPLVAKTVELAAAAAFCFLEKCVAFRMIIAFSKIKRQYGTISPKFTNIFQERIIGKLNILDLSLGLWINAWSMFPNQNWNWNPNQSLIFEFLGYGNLIFIILLFKNFKLCLLNEASKLSEISRSLIP